MSRHVRRSDRSRGAPSAPTVAARVRNAEERIISLSDALDRPEKQLRDVESSTQAVLEDLDRFRMSLKHLIKTSFDQLHESVEKEHAAEQSSCDRAMDDMSNDQADGQNMLRRIQKLDAGVQSMCRELGVAEDPDGEDY